MSLSVSLSIKKLKRLYQLRVNSKNDEVEVVSSFHSSVKLRCSFALPVTDCVVVVVVAVVVLVVVEVVVVVRVTGGEDRVSSSSSSSSSSECA